MNITEIGKLFFPGRTHWREGVWFDYTAIGPVLVFAFKNPSDEEILATRKGQVELALYDDPPVLFILHRIEGLEDWSDCPFSVRLCKDEIDLSLPIEEGKGLGLQIVLVESATGIVKALRLVGTSTEFARELRAAMVKQTIMPFSPDEYDRAIAEVYTMYTSDQLLKKAMARHTI
jgi:hypothetical protein